MQWYIFDGGWGISSSSCGGDSLTDWSYNIVEAINGDAAERSRIHPMTDLVDLVLEKISFTWKLENTTPKQSITNDVNSARKQPTSTSEHPNPMSQFSPISVNNEPLSMFTTYT